MFVLTVACTSSESSREAQPTSLSPPDAKELAANLASGDAEAVAQALEPALRAHVSEVALPAGSSVDIDSSSFEIAGKGLGTVVANVHGPISGDYLLYLIWEGGRWRVYAAEQS